MKVSAEEKQQELLTLKEASLLLKCHPNSLRTWNKSGILQAVRLGKSKMLKYRRQDIENLLIIQSESNKEATHLSPKIKLSAIKKFLIKHADSIQKMATKEHKRYLGGGLFRSEIIKKYQDLHIRTVKEFANYLDDKDKGI